jgi:type I restriction enzyme S subunit
MELYKKHISDLGRIVTGKTPRTSIPENYGGHIPFLTPSDDLSGKYAYKTSKTLSELGLKEVKNCLLPPNSICVSCIGSDLGKVVITNKPTVTNQQFNSIIPNEENNADFVYYLMSVVGKHLNFLSKTSTAVPIINKSSFSDFEIEIPSIDDQIRIATILSFLDEKIECNRRINDNFTLSFLLLTCFVLWLLKLRNDNLEQQAQALFKSWYVDFEPFKDGEFVESEMGMIPKGWRVGSLGEILEIKYGKDHKKLSDGIIPVYGSGGLMRYAEKSLYEGESVLIPRKGTLNNVMYVNEAFWTVDTMFYTIPKTQNSILFAYFLLSNKDLASMNSGSAVPSMTTEILNNIQFVMPVSDVLAEFNTLVSSYYAQIKHYDQESRRLAQLRDTLLPRLMSGELKVSHID